MRSASVADSADIHYLTQLFVAEGLLLPRTVEEIEANVTDYVVVVDSHDRVRACAALSEYSPSLAEVTSVAVAPDAQGLGLGTLAVRGAEAMARDRGVGEVFALSLASAFFESLGYQAAALTDYPEKLARYESLSARGVQIKAKPCFRKRLA